MFDTHCHLNFHTFEVNLDQVINTAFESGITDITVPGTDVVSSKKAVLIAESHLRIYAAVGIHPHHVYQYQQKGSADIEDFEKDLVMIEDLLGNPKVVAVGEIGLDRHYYEKTKYTDYIIDEQFMKLQKSLFVAQIDLAKRYKKSLILHNREAKQEFLATLSDLWEPSLERKVVLHCCEPDPEFLSFSTSHKTFIGVDGDVTYSKKKQEFAKKIPLSSLVLETDSPFLLPEPYRSYKKSQKPHNTPDKLRTVGAFIAKLKGVSEAEIFEATTKNAKELFQL